MKETTNPKAAIHKEWKAAKKKRDDLWQQLNDPCDPNHRAKTKEWHKYFKLAAKLYAELTAPDESVPVAE